ncbi:DUF6498-containing protein [Haloarchaeobius sp. DFWS5]|uniref:DUF6498-containing protein n=1 Tax=Haloarchaeobius sp. DFWS5 TaxID=3446114 RepID=UPI003EBA0633
MRLTPARDATPWSILAANAMLLAGVFVFGWSVELVLVLYWFESGVVLCRNAVEALFAQRLPSEWTRQNLPLERLVNVRGSVEPVSWLPPLYPRNVPFVGRGLFIFALFWPIAGVVTLGLYGLSDPATGSHALLALPVVVGRHVVELVQYVRTGRYEDESAQSAFSGLQALLLLVLSVVALFLAAIGGTAHRGSMLTFGLVFCCKFGYDLVDANVLGLGDFADRHTDDGVTDPDPISLPERAPYVRVSTTTRSVALEAGLLGALETVAGVTPLLLCVAGFVGLFAGGLVGAAIGVLAVGVARTTIELVVAWLTVGTIEYRVYPESVVGYNTLFDEPQWRVAYDDLEEVVTRHEDTKRYVPEGFGRIRLKEPDRKHTILDHLPDAEELAAYIEWARDYEPWEPKDDVTIGAWSTDDASHDDEPTDRPSHDDEPTDHTSATDTTST